MVEIEQAFVSAFIAGAFGLPIAHDNMTYTPSAGSAYAQLKVLQNDSSAFDIGGATKDTDGVFRVVLRYPVDAGSIVAKTKADAIFAAFEIGAKICYGGVCCTVTHHQLQPGSAEKGWYKLVLTMRYVCFY